MQLYLALSGGGFRATIFHLGVIRYLRDSGLLSNVAAICSVSGGSLTAAHVVLKWTSYTNTSYAGEIEQREAEIRTLTQIGMRERLVRRLPWYWLGRRLARYWLFPFRQLDKTITVRLAQYYEEYLFDQSRLDDVDKAHLHGKAPTLDLMTTNLTVHSARTHFHVNKYLCQDQRTSPAITRSVTVGGFPVSKAVAASSAFPFLFPPLRLGYNDADVEVSQDALGAIAHYLTDGGVFENLGISVLRDAIAAEPNDDMTLIVSDAGRKLDWDLDNTSSRDLANRLLRSSEITQYWSESRLGVGRGARELVIRIDEPIDAQVVSNAPPTNVQRAVANLRTDFDSFSDLEWTALFSQGYSIAKQVLAKLAPAVLPGRDPYRPWQANGVDWRGSKTAKKLAAGRKRRLHLFSFRTMDGYFAANVLTIFLIILAAYLIIGRPWVKPPGARDIELDTLSAREIELETPFLASDFDLMSKLQLSNAYVQDQVTLAYNTLKTLTVSEQREVIVVPQRGDFSQNLNTFRGAVAFRGNARVEVGIALLIEAGESLGMRDDPKVRWRVVLKNGGLVIDRPKKGERLVMVLLVGPRDFPGKETFPERNTDRYHPFVMDAR